MHKLTHNAEHSIDTRLYEVSSVDKIMVVKLCNDIFYFVGKHKLIVLQIGSNTKGEPYQSC